MMERVRTSRVHMEVDSAPVSAASPPLRAPPSTPSAAPARQHTSPQQAPKRMTMRERAQALREARLKRLSKSANNKSHRSASDHPQDVDAPIPTEQLAPDNAQQATAAPHPSQVQATQQQPNQQQQSQPVPPKRHAADAKHSKAQGTARAKAKVSPTENSAANNASTEKALPNVAEPHTSPDHAHSHDPEQPVPSAPSAPPNAGSKASKTASTARADRRKRKSTTDAVQPNKKKDEFDNDADVVLASANVDPAPLGARKKARVEKDKSSAPPKAPPKSQKKKKGKHALQSSSTANSTAPSTHIPVDSQQHGSTEAPSKKTKSLRSSSRVLDEDIPLVHDKNNNSAPSSKPPLPAAIAEQHPKPQQLEGQPRSRDRKSKRLLNRQRKDANSEEPEPPRRAEATVDEENHSKTETDSVEPNPDIKTQRQTRSNKRKKAKRSAAEGVESTNKVSAENDHELASSKANMTPRRSPRSAAKSKSPHAAEEKNKSGADLDATDMADVEDEEWRPAIGAEKAAAHATEGAATPGAPSAAKGRRTSPKERALQSVTKSNRFVLSASQQGARFVQARDSTMNGSRRQSLSHREGLSRLTSVVDQLQREGEAFLEKQHRICDELIPLSSECGAHKVFQLVQGYVGAAVSDDDRKAIADSALRDAVICAKLEFQAKQRAVITELAESLVKAVKDWKNSKNAVLRDIIPEELRPETVAPIAAFEQRMTAADDGGSAAVGTETTGVLNEKHVDQGKGDGGGLGTDGTHEQVMNGRRESVSGLRVLENAQQLRQYAGFAYSELNLECYRSCAILKLCEFEDGLSFDELYSITPIGKVKLKRKLASLVEAKYLTERLVHLRSGETLTVYRTAAHVIGRAGGDGCR